MFEGTWDFFYNMSLKTYREKMMNYKDLAASIELSDYCLEHGYTFTWCHWLEGILFTRRSDESEFAIKGGVSAAKVYEAIRDAVANESDDPLKDFLEPVMPALRNSVL